MGYNAGHIEKRPVYLLFSPYVVGEGPFRTDALRFRNFCFDRGVIPSVGVFMELFGKLLSHQSCQGTDTSLCEVADGMDALHLQFFFRLLSYP